MTLRILLVEDSAADAELSLARLSREGLEVVHLRVDSASELEAALTQFVPDVVLCDHGVPGLPTLSVLARVRASTPRAAFIVVTGALDMATVVKTIEAGADDVLLKSDLARLAGSMRRALERRATLAELSPRQVEVLRLVAAGLTSREIADRLGVSLKTVETHRSEMMRRLDIHDVAGLVRYAFKVRLLSPDD